MEDGDVLDERLVAEEVKARERNYDLEKKRKASLKKKRRAISHEDKEKKAKELDDLLKKSKAFSDILTQKTQVLGRVGTSLDGKALGDHDLAMAKQPECLVGGTMRDYQLEGVTWMYEVCSQGMSGILADEMGLGKPFFLYSRTDADWNQARLFKPSASSAFFESRRIILALTSSSLR